MKKILIVIPSYSGKVRDRVTDVVKSREYNNKTDKFLCNVEIITRRLIHTARNMAIEMTLNGWYDYLLMCDDDNAPVNDNALQLLLDANVDIISWIIRKRKYPHKLAVFDTKRDMQEGFYNLTEWDNPPAPSENWLHPVGNVWTGFILYSRGFLEKIYNKYDKVPFESKLNHFVYLATGQRVELERSIWNPLIVTDKNWKLPVVRQELSEDLLFHYRAMFMGYKIYVHDQVLLDHRDGESGQIFSV